MGRPVRSFSPWFVALAVWSLWIIGVVAGNRWSLFADGWPMTLTMIVGSFIAGATSEGGGAVAFPVMTLAMEIPPPVARDFALMIQSVGMSSATAAIVIRGIPVLPAAILWAGLGGAVGVLVGRAWIAPMVPPSYAKILFTSLWLSFALALYRINRDRARAVRRSLEGPAAAPLLGVGVVGGVVSSITGSGLDILTFAWLVLSRRVCEGVATPTSVVLMASNSICAFAGSALVGPAMHAEAWRYWWVCVPVVVVGAPLGALFVAGRSRLFVAGFLYLSIVVQFVAAMVIIPQSLGTIAFAAAVLGAGLVAFDRLARAGRRLDTEGAGTRERGA